MLGAYSNNDDTKNTTNSSIKGRLEAFRAQGTRCFQQAFDMPLQRPYG